MDEHGFVKRDHCTALWAVQHPSMTPTGFFDEHGFGNRDAAATATTKLTWQQHKDCKDSHMDMYLLGQTIDGINKNLNEDFMYHDETTVHPSTRKSHISCNQLCIKKFL